MKEYKKIGKPYFGSKPQNIQNTRWSLSDVSFQPPASLKHLGLGGGVIFNSFEFWKSAHLSLFASYITIAKGDLEFLSACPKLSGVSLCLDHIGISKESSAVKVDLCSESGDGEDPASTPGWDQSG